MTCPDCGGVIELCVDAYAVYDPVVQDGAIAEGTKRRVDEFDDRRLVCETCGDLREDELVAKLAE